MTEMYNSSGTNWNKMPDDDDDDDDGLEEVLK